MENLNLPECCYADVRDPLAVHLYAAYNRGGEESTAGRSFQGDPCPMWPDLPENVRAKWQAVADFVASENTRISRMYAHPPSR